ncbi:MAG: hypothetical protein AUH29_14095 [Candidatus Rokubacteria bacterium 13_1_40CM_69_27]|nr:MAG: hypothetical protein AUH29_14095 [Candidatus Rokubacteria bacterium 13_1_40CM_69_27]OLC30641.1 MAG: hypothetical protein AUH81_19815 [Candidatus Rokubacteria bacterium 13_1_40CM_4_69_5]
MNLRRVRRAVPLLLLGLFAALLVLGVRAVGPFLVVADRLEPSDAIIVLEGGTPAREVEAAVLYRRELAPVVVLALARDPFPVARQLAGEPILQERAARALEYAGVPRHAIVRLERQAENTAQELQVDFEHARARGFRRVILVTSPQHTRRVRVIWNARYQARIPALVHPTLYEPFVPGRWWRSRRSLEEGLHELVAIAHFFIGSPLPTFDRGD